MTSSAHAPPPTVWLPAHPATLPPNTPPTTPAQWVFSRAQVDAYYGQPVPPLPPGAPPASSSSSSSGSDLRFRDPVRYFRERGVQFAHHIGYRMQLPPSTLACAATFFHRFYMRRGFATFPHYDVAATCVLVATKADEHFVKIASLSTAAAKSANKGPPMSSSDLAREADKWKSKILHLEPLVCEAIAFDLYVAYPARPLANFLATTAYAKTLYQVAATVLADSYRTTAVLQFQPAVIAAACLHIAKKVTGKTMDNDWMDQMVGRGRRIDVLEAAAVILDVYQPAAAGGAPLPPIAPPPPPSTTAGGAGTRRSSLSPSGSTSFADTSRTGSTVGGGMSPAATPGAPPPRDAHPPAKNKRTLEEVVLMARSRAGGSAMAPAPAAAAAAAVPPTAAAEDIGSNPPPPSKHPPISTRELRGERGSDPEPGEVGTDDMDVDG
ncbi:hypothetical protein H9P43_004540 [Blastocladiella emersonii ATCC 22665]|nr:hypothetical protein H9P43_004540 [Blastocladiella emersonii ATCC 22665]